jgi:hypothetical protein
VLVAGVLIGIVLSPVGLGRFAPQSWQQSVFGGAALEQRVTDAEQEFAQLLRQQFKDMNAEHQQRMQRLEETGVSAAATQEAEREHEKATQMIEQWLDAESSLERLSVDYQRESLQALIGAESMRAIQQAKLRYQARAKQLQQAAVAVRDRQAAQWLVAVMLAIAVVMAVEPLLAPQPAEKGGQATVSPALARLVSVRYALLAIALALLLIRPGLLVSQTLIFAALIVLVAVVVGLVPLNWKRRKAPSA